MVIMIIYVPVGHEIGHEALVSLLVLPGTLIDRKVWISLIVTGLCPDVCNLGCNPVGQRALRVGAVC